MVATGGGSRSAWESQRSPMYVQATHKAQNDVKGGGYGKMHLTPPPRHRNKCYNHL